jgi:CheY-like chemotaxis protein
MRRLLIVDASQVYTEALRGILKDEFELLICHDGETAIETLHTFQPEVLIINLMLPFKDGLTVLQESRHRPRIILAISPFVNPYVEYAAIGVGIQYLMITPSVHSLHVRLMDMIAADQPCKESPVAQAATHLHILNFATHLDGYRQLCVGIPMLAHNPDVRLSKELYPAIAQHFGGIDARSVEHSIRKAIHTAWARRDPLVWAKYFSPEPDGTLLCPTNKEFLCRLANMLE